MNFKQMIKVAIMTPGSRHRWGIPLNIEGPPGAAKTSLAEEACGELGLHIETLLGSIREPTDFVGLPGQDKNEKYAKYRAFEWVKHVAEDYPRSVVFLDELSTVAPSVQKALLRVALEGVVGDVKLPDTVRFIAAMNPPGQAADGYDLAAPLANRFGHVKTDGVQLDQWTDWLLGGANGTVSSQVDPAEEEKRVMNAWPEPFAIACGTVAGFLRAKPSLFHKMPPENNPELSRAWPSARTWEFATRALAGAVVHGLDGSGQLDMMAAYIGDAVASEFYTYRKLLDLPDPAKLLDGEVKWKYDPQRLDLDEAVYSSCSALVCTPSAAKRKPRAAALWKLLGGAVEAQQQDVVFAAARALVRAGLSHDIPESRAVHQSLLPVMKAAGLSVPAK